VRVLLDTCILSELVKPRPDEKVVRWVDAQNEDHLFLSVLIIGELQKGIAKLPESPRRTALRDWLEQDLTERFAGRILPVDAGIALTWGRLQGEAERLGTKLPVIDALLTATAIVHDLTIATRNVADFVRCGAAIVNPWED